MLTSVLYAAPKPANPADPATIILNAFRTHPIIALSEGQHWNEQGHAFRASLLRDPRLSKVVNDIVVEFGDAGYQGIIDRYIAGSDVPLAICPASNVNTFCRLKRQGSNGAPKALPKCSPSLHVPAQSGSNDVLARMKRGYTVEDYREMYGRLRDTIPDAAVTS